jgi:hypothetical protein
MTAASRYDIVRANQAATEQAEVPRDRYGRPLIVPPDGGPEVPYTRVSTLAKALDDLNQLVLWGQRKTAEGLLRRPDLQTRLAGIPDTDWATKRDLNKVCAEAKEAAGASTGASSGTGLHALTEAIDRGEEPEFVPAADRPRLDAYRAATEGYEAISSVGFVVCDEIHAAGSFDRLWRCPDGKVRIGDLKTGKSEKAYPLATTVQMAIYAHGLRYDPATHERAPLHPDLDLTTGLLIHMPASGGCEIVPLNLELGWKAAAAADLVHHDIRKWRASDLIREVTA